MSDKDLISEYDNFINTFFCLAKKLDKNVKFDIITNENDEINNEYTLFCNDINKNIISHCYTSFFPPISQDITRKFLPESYFAKSKINEMEENVIKDMLNEIKILNACTNKNEEDFINSERYIYMKYDKFKSGISTLIKFVKYKLLYIGDFGEYYLLNDKELSWNNIKELKLVDTIQNNTLIDYISKKYKTSHIAVYKILLWYFRKIFVNSLIFDLVGYYKTCKGKENDFDLDFNSVGSIKISSDYDITLSGNNYKYISLIIGKFTSIVERIFKNSEDFVFDTNIYGVGFSKKTSKKDRLDKLHYGCEITCNNTQFCITKLNIKNEKKDINDQHIWAFIKLLSNLQICIKQNEIYIKCDDKNKSNVLSNDFQDSYNCILDTIIQSYNKLYKNEYDLISSNDEDYVLFLLNKADKFIKKHPKSYGFKDSDFFYGIYANLIATADKLIDKYGINNYISLVNYYGVETYYTRGAYLDVVVNQQTCKNTLNMNSTNVNKDGYLDSFIENCSDFILHNFKDKYKKRALSALYNILSDNKQDEFIHIKITSLTNEFDKIINDNSPFISKIINIYAYILNIFKRVQTQPDIFNYKINWTSPGKKKFGRASTVKSYVV